jgi:hypothetical protein
MLRTSSLSSDRTEHHADGAIAAFSTMPGHSRSVMFEVEKADRHLLAEELASRSGMSPIACSRTALPSSTIPMTSY